MSEPYDISSVEEVVRNVFCRTPDAVKVFHVPYQDFLSPATRAVVQAAQELHAQGRPATVEYLAAAGAGTLDQLRDWARRATHQEQEDFLSLAPLVRLAAQQRALVAWHEQQRDAILRAPLLDIPDLLTQSRATYAQLVVPAADTAPSEIGAIIEDEEAKDEAQLGQPMPTGIRYVDTILKGGVRVKQLHGIAGRFGGGKTTVLRCMLRRMAGFRVEHIAADGGEAREQMWAYLAIEAYTIARAWGIPIPPGVLHTENIAIWRHNTNERRSTKLPYLVVPSDDMHEALHAARNELVALRSDGYLNIVDFQAIGGSVSELIARCERDHHVHGVQVVGIDYLGKFGNKNKAIYDRFPQLVGELEQLFHRLPMAGIVLSQLNKTGIEKGMDNDSYDVANLQGGQALEEVVHSMWLVNRKGPFTEIRATKLRKGLASDHAPLRIATDGDTGVFEEA